MKKREQVFIGGKWNNAGDNATIDVLNPATGAAIGTVPGAAGPKQPKRSNSHTKHSNPGGLPDLMNGPMCSTVCTRR